MILPSGRLGINRDNDRYITGLQSLLSANAQSTIDDAVCLEALDPNEDDGIGDLPVADELAVIEWGFSFSDVTSFIRELVGMSLEAGQHDVGVVAVRDVRRRMSTALDWGDDKIEALLQELTLKREPDF